VPVAQQLEESFMIISRRSFAAATAGGMLAASAARSAQLGDPDSPPQGPEGIKGNPHSSSDPGPQNKALDAQFPNDNMPPSTDLGSVENFWFPFSAASKRVQNGGWSREVTVKELPIAKSLAGVNMRLTAGGVRELPGIPHSIQGLDPDGCEFLLVFDDGAFSEFSTFLPTTWMAHTPVEVLSKNFSVPADGFKPIPLHELYIFQAAVPGPLTNDQNAAMGRPGITPESFKFPLMKQEPKFSSPHGEVRIADSRNFPIASTLAAAHVTVHPGAMREMHWHPNADEWQYYMSGTGRMTIFAGGANIRTKDFHTGDVGYVPRSMGHFIENTGSDDLIFLEVFASSYYSAISFSQWLRHTPPELVKAHFNFSDEMLNSIPRGKTNVIGS
jgi:oxalate decarboxylase